MTPEEAQKVLAENIRRASAARGVTLNALADFAEVSRSQLYDVLSGEKSATVEWLTRLAGALDAEPWELLKPQHFEPPK